MNRLPLSEKVQRVEESQTLALAAKALRLKSSGVDVISLTAGEPDFPTPEHIKSAAIDAIRSDFTHYTANKGIPELLEAIQNKFSRENGLRFGTDQLLVSCGAKHSIFNALVAICNPGDEVLITSPYWVSYPQMVRLADGEPVIVPTTREFSPDISSIRKGITDKTKAIILNSPGNPSGIVYNRETIEELVSVVAGTGIYLLSDEIYEKVIYDSLEHISIGSYDDIRDQVITINGVSKAFAMTGWRIGYMGGPADVVSSAAKVQSQATSNVNSIAQKAAVAALNVDTPDVSTMVSEFSRRRDVVIDCLKRIPGTDFIRPSGAFYLLLNVQSYYGKHAGGKHISGSVEMSNYLLEHYRVATVPGSAFGVDEYLRISYACSMENIRNGLKRIEDGLNALRN